MNNGGVRAPLSAGPITWGDLIGILPFSNQIVILNISGANLTRAVARGVAASGAALSTIAGLRFTIDLSCGPAEDGRIRNLTLVDGDGRFVARVEDSQYYRLATNGFVSGGGDGYSMLVDLPKVGETSSDLEALADLIRALPGQAVTDTLGLFASGGYDTVGPAPDPIDHSLRATVVGDPADETVVVSHAFDALDIDWRGETGVWAPFYRYKLSARTYIAKNASLLKAIVAEDIGYAAVNGIIVAGGETTVEAADRLDDEPHRLVRIVPCRAFESLDRDGVCTTNGGAVAAVVLSVAALGCAVALIARRCRRRRPSASGLTERILPPTYITDT
jgi:hypothetical protein